MIKLNFADLDENNLLLVVTPSEFAQETNLFVLKYFLNEKNASCVYVSVAKPYSSIVNLLEKNKIKSGKIFFIDCTARISLAGEMERFGNCVCVPPQALTNLSIALSSAIESLPKERERILILDTVSTLMLYNEAKTVTKFVHFLSSKLRQWNVKSIVSIVSEDGNSEIISQLSPFFDKTIKVGI